ncbi:MAG TPA: hypothetical protein VHA77_04390 [Xanthobacteraceae bacterium]|nr:hypothetical protein [Xanthobacteraceae bacterium]
MILSIRHKFIFVRGRKVAGTSVEMALSTICGPSDIATPMIAVDELTRQRMQGHCGNYSGNPAFEKAYIAMVLASPPERLIRLRPPPGRYRVHMSVADIAKIYPGPIADYRVVSIQRNPYERVISFLNMKQSISAYRDAGEMRGRLDRIADEFDRAAANSGLSLLRNTETVRPTDPAQQIRMFRHETLQADFDAFLRECGIARRVELPFAKRGLMSQSLDPRQILRRDQLNLINATFADEFEAGGYRTL